MAKSLFTSKTFIFNVVGIANAIAAYFGYSPLSDEQASAILAAGNIVLRYFTSVPVTLGSSE